MAEVTVKQFAEVVGVPVNLLLEQLKEAGVSVTDPDATISEEEKLSLLTFLKNKHPKKEKAEKKVTLTRRAVNEVKTKTSQGRTKTVRGSRDRHRTGKARSRRGPAQARGA